jgi:hypothetical protein
MHYKNGREAHVGDKVVGTVFNTKGIISGTLVSLTPGPDSCSAMVGFLVTKPVEELASPRSGMAMEHVVREQGSEQHGSSGVRIAICYLQDYTEVKYLLHAEDAMETFDNFKKVVEPPLA